jgi:hypothetical protein
MRASYHVRMTLPSPRSRRGWCVAAAGAALVALATVPGRADEPSGPASDPAGSRQPHKARCLSEAEIREEVTAKRIIPQVAALRAARAAGGGEAVRARVCRGEEGLVYAITSLKRDGKVLRIELDAATGHLVERN